MSDAPWLDPVKLKQLQDTIYAEVGGGSPEEVAAVISVFLNRAKKKGIDKAFKGSAAYNRKSPEYMKAAESKMNPYEQKIYDRNSLILQNLVEQSDKVLPYNYFENVNAFGEPPWAKDMKESKDIGRQRFYVGEY